MAIWNRLTAFVTGGAVATAAADAMAPEFEVLKQTAWSNEPHKVLGAHEAAELAARSDVDGIPGIDLEGVDLADDAARGGIGSHRFSLLKELAQTEPGLGQLIAMRRRNMVTGGASGISDPELTYLLRRSGYAPDVIHGLRSLVESKLTPAQIALGIVRSLLPDPGFLPVDLDVSGGKVPSYRTSDIDPVAEALEAGIDRERLRVMVGEIGLPMALDAAAQSTFRGIIDEADYNRAVLEGDTRPEWAAAILEHARQIPSVADYVNAHIRGWISEAEMHAGAARHGMSAADVDLLYLRTGRPAAPGQMATAAARGINGPEGRPMDRAQFLKGIAESDIRPEWGQMLWESRYLYPPLFQIGRLVQAGAITPDTGADWATKDRYPPEVVAALHAFWSQPQAGGADTHLAKAQTQLWSTTHRSYIANESDDETASAALEAAGVPAPLIPQVLALWTHERSLTRRQLTAAQVKKAYRNAVINPDTGVAWNRDDALAALLERGYSHADATTFLDS